MAFTKPKDDDKDYNPEIDSIIQEKIDNKKLENQAESQPLTKPEPATGDQS
jgi:hypothetical protein